MMNAMIYDKAVSWIDAHRDELIADLITLVNIKSISGQGERDGAPFGQDCRDVLDATLAMGQAYGLVPEDYEGYVGRLSLRPGFADIGIWGHLDVVPEGDNWIFEPYNAIYKDGYVIGRGSNDNKGSIVSAMHVLRALRELNYMPKKNIGLYLGTNEEAGMDDVQYFTRYYDAPSFSLVPDCGFPLCHAEKGIIEANLVSIRPLTDTVISLRGGTASNVVPDSAQMVIRNTPEAQAKLAKLPERVKAETLGDEIHLTAFGTAGHTAFPAGSINAIKVLTRALLDTELLPSADLDNLYFIDRVNEDAFGTNLHIDCADEISGRLTCVGSVLRLLEDGRVSLCINIRYPVKADSEKIINSISTACAQSGYAMELLKDSRPMYVPANHPVVEKLMAVYNDITGADAKPFTMAGGTYARKLPNAVGFGLGINHEKPISLFPAGHGGAHGPDEAVLVDDLIDGAKIYLRALLEMDDMQL